MTNSNAKIFDEPVYKYSRELLFMFEEMNVPVRFEDGDRAEAVLLEVAREHAEELSALGGDALRELERRYFLAKA